MMERGDVLLFHRKTFSPMTWLIQKLTRSRWNHAAMAIDAVDYVEATSSGVRVTGLDDLSYYDDEVLIVPIQYDDEDDELTTVAFAAGRVGIRYGYFNAFFCGLRHILPGFIQIKFGDSVICSELVAEALERAGMDFGKDTALVSPGDLGERLGVGR